MGKIIHAKCTQCDYEKEFHTGAGLRDCELDTIMNALPRKQQDALTYAVHRGAKYISINRILCKCEECGRLFVLPVVTYKLKDTEYTIAGVCEHCGCKEYMQIDTMQNTECTECGAQVLLHDIGHWD